MSPPQLFFSDFILQQCSVGPVPSPLLLSYLEQALQMSLIPVYRFFHTLCDVASPSRPLQYAAFLTLIRRYLPHVRLSSSSSKREALTMSKEASEAEGSTLEVVLRVAHTLLRAVADLFHDLQQQHPKREEPDGTHHMEGEESDEEEGSQRAQATNNLITSIRTLTDLFTNPRSLAFLLAAKARSPDQWQPFFQLCQSLYSSFSSSCSSSCSSSFSTERKRELRHMLQPLWKGLQLVLNPNVWVGRTIRAPLCKSLYATLAPYNSNAYNRSWLALTFLLHEEIHSAKVFRGAQRTVVRLKKLKELRGLNWYPFLCELWAASLRLHRFASYPSREYDLTRNFLLVKLPLLLKHWKEEMEAERTFLDKKLLRHHNAIELSLVHLTQFPLLFSQRQQHSASDEKGEQTEWRPPLSNSSADLWQEMVEACSNQELVSKASIYALLDGRHPPKSLDSVPEENVQEEAEAKIVADITFETDRVDSSTNKLMVQEEMENLIEGLYVSQHQEDEEQRLSSVVALVTDLTGGALFLQEWLVDRLLKMTTPNPTLYQLSEEVQNERDKQAASIPSATAVSLIFSALTQETALGVFHQHGKLPALASNAFLYCDIWGSKTVDMEPRKQHRLFSRAFLLLVSILENFEVRSISENQSKVHRTDGFRFLISKYHTSKQMKTGSHVVKEEKMEEEEVETETEEGGESKTPNILSWYRGYLFEVLPWHNSLCQEPTSTIPVVGDKILLSLLSSAASTDTSEQDASLGGDNLPSATQSPLAFTDNSNNAEDTLNQHNPLELIESLPYVLHQLAIASVHSVIPLSRTTRVLTQLVDALPYAYALFILWFNRQFFMGSGRIGTSPHSRLETPPPSPASTLTILSTFLQARPLPSSVKTAVGPRLKTTLAGFSRNPELQVVAQQLAPVSAPKPKVLGPIISNVFQQHFYFAFTEAHLRNPNLESFTDILHRLGHRHFCELMLKAIIATISVGMHSKHSLRVAELGGCLLAFCGDTLSFRSEARDVQLHRPQAAYYISELMAEFFSYCVPLCQFGKRTQFYGQLLAYVVAVSLAVSDQKMPHSKREQLPYSDGEMALVKLLEHATGLLEEGVEHPSSALSFPLTLLQLCTAIPSVFAYAPTARLVSVLKALGHHDLVLAIFLAQLDTNPSSSFRLQDYF
ncbi:Mediator of RNA polymerase II transcription subunit 24, variant 3 [Balamuthia mandrillaris]